jgi:CheY-like chemotaxis protein
MKRILLVDDDDAYREGVRRVLVSRGYDVVESRDGREALRRPDLAGVDLVITDIVMPEIEGLELITRLRGARPDVKILAVSGSPYALPGNYLEVARKMGAAATLTKPFGVEELVDAVRGLVGG